MNKQEITRANNLRCPRCQLLHIKCKGHTYYGKQNYQCKLCDRQIVERRETVSAEKRRLIKSLLPERISLRGIYRILRICLAWLLNFDKQHICQRPKICGLSSRLSPKSNCFLRKVSLQ